MARTPATSALLVTQHYWPEPIGSAPYCTDIAEWMALHGMAVRVFTCRPHYPEGHVPHAYRRGRKDLEWHGGVRVDRVPPFRPWGRSALDRMAREVMFLLQGLAAMATRRLKRSDVVVSLCPSILTVLLGALATRRGGCHLALVHDIQSGLATSLGMVNGGRMAQLMRWVERAVLNRAGVVLVLSENMRAHLRAQGVTAPIEIFPIWVDTARFQRLKPPPRNEVTVVYSGNFGKKQALGQIIDMVACLEARGHDDLRVVLRGEGNMAEQIAAEVSARGLRSIRFAPLVPLEHLPQSLAEGTIHLVPQDAAAADFAVPSKTYAIMAAGRPFVAVARPGSLLWNLRELSDGFLCVPPDEPEIMAGAVERLARDRDLRERLGRNGRNYVALHHDKAGVLGRFLTIAATQRKELHDVFARSASSRS